ncbi:MAG: PilZ domain-containing protein [Candidatus Omnitrophica bacterium]|nr:PilZ domain-containing protein [Candidatus Omnitrophota bacterium]
MATNDPLEQERRQYIRLDSVFPVQFQLLNPDTKEAVSAWLQGFTNNISKGGICLAINNLDQAFALLIKNRQVRISLGIEMPFSRTPIAAVAQIAWVQASAEQPGKYFIGLRYENISAEGSLQIIRYARAKRLFVPLVLGVIIALGAAFAVDSYINVKLVKGNKALVSQLVKILQESSVAKQKIKEINKDRDDLQVRIEALKARIRTVEEDKAKLSEQTKLEEANTMRRVAELNALIDTLSKEKTSAQEALISLQHKENTVTEELLNLDKRKASLERANLDKMYQWLTIHQNPRTGLVMSFEGDSDIDNWAFIYDESLALQAYVNFSDFERAKKMLEFFDKKAKRQNKLFFNAYYADDGTPAEFIVHSGPNIWLGIAIVQYVKRTGDPGYLKLAEEIAQDVMQLQAQDPDGGIRGGPEVQWYATEHNLDAYAFYDMLHKTTRNDAYAQARDRVLNWLVKHTYGKTDLPIKRGKGDSTIATDTYAWSIAAIGPAKLEELGMNPDRIMEFAEEHCSVEVEYLRPGEAQPIKIKGFDFAPQVHVARGGIVSSEWTAQMVISFKIMADFYHKKGMIAKSRAYLVKADEYLANLSNMIISSPSPSGQGESCLPYATQELADTGHGWMTPRGNSTGSVSGTTYTIFAYYNYNPLELKD